MTDTTQRHPGGPVTRGRERVVPRHFGFAGHLIVAEYCRFHLTTEVGSYLVSTVGAYVKPGREGEWTEVGCGRKFETFVFRLGGKCDCGTDCGQRAVADWSEIDSRAANTPGEATKAHEAMVRKYLNRARKEVPHAE